MQIRLSGDRRSQGRVHAVVPIGCLFADRRTASAPSWPLASAMRALARPPLAHAETGLRTLPGALCVTAGSQPEPSVLVVLSSPDLIAGAGVPNL